MTCSHCLERHVGDWQERADPGIVDQDVEPADTVHGHVHEPLDVGIDTNVGAYRRHRRPQIARGLRHAGLVGSRDHHARALIDEGARNRKADAPRAARHHGHLPRPTPACRYYNTFG